MEDDVAQYSIGWIAPLSLELTAAKAMLDEDHGDIHVDGYIYHGGRIGEHNVVMAVQPKMGTDAASDLAARMRAAFRNIEYFMVVGIGGGVPSYGPSGAQSQIVLGDIVVSYPRGDYGGVVRYDFGAWTEEDGLPSLQFRWHTNSPPDPLLNAVNSLQTRHSMICGTKIPAFLRQMRLNINIGERQKFEDQDAVCDRLFHDGYLHPKESANEDCEACCELSQSKMRQYRGSEAVRQRDTPKIHYGNIASSNQLQISAAKRNRLHDDFGVICFEMEGAGVIQKHHCLVIRGICDYSDSHKNKKWQPYAAATAAAYTKELLGILPARKSLRIHSAAKHTTQERTQNQKDSLRSLAFEEMNMRGNDIQRQTSHTCSWLLEHERYKSWLNQEDGLLWIKGNPGVGKSTLMKYALHECKKRMTSENQFVIASFFFHGRGSPLQKSPLGLFRSLLFQILDQVPELLDEFTSIFRKRCDTEGEEWNWHQTELQDFLQQSVPPVSKARDIRIYIDALDECGEEGARDLVKFFQCLISELPHSGPATLSICFSCRYYPIVALERGLTIHVEKENYSDISIHIRSELNREDLDEDDAQTLQEEILIRASGVFIWVVLVIPRILEFYRDGRSLDEVISKLRDIPEQLDDLYQQILRKTKVEYQAESLQLLQWICFAVEPLPISELRSAMAVDADTRYKTLDECHKSPKFAKTNEQMENRVKSLSGGLIEVVEYWGRRIAQFIHQSVKDYLTTRGLQSLDDSSQGSVAGQAHFQLSRSCIKYITMKEVTLIDFPKVAFSDMKHKFPFVQYAVTNWVQHAKEVEVEGILQEDLLDLFGWPSDKMIKIWVQLYKTLSPFPNGRYANDITLLHIGSGYGFKSTVAAVIRRRRSNTILHIGSRYGLKSIVAGAFRRCNTDVDPKDLYGRTPLSVAAREGRETVVQLLLEKGADVDSKDSDRRTPLSWAAGHGREAVIRLLLEQGADIDSKDSDGGTPLSWAAGRGREAVIRLLLEQGANIDSKDSDGRTPLSWAAGRGKEAAVRLLDQGADIDSKDSDGRTPLSWAAGRGREEVIRLLLDQGADIDSKDSDGRTPLSWAAGRGREEVIRLLLDEGADIDSKDSDGRTPLSWAAGRGRKAAVRLLLDQDADIDSKDSGGRTPLSWAAGRGMEEVIRLLLDEGADIDSKDSDRRTPLSWAAGREYEAAVRLLLDEGADIDSKDSGGRTPLSWAAGRGRGVVVQLLLEKGAKCPQSDNEGDDEGDDESKDKSKDRVKPMAINFKRKTGAKLWQRRGR